LVLGLQDLNGDGASFQMPIKEIVFPGESRNNDRLPWSTTFDLECNTKLRSGNNKLELRADIFNI
jgi:hypothetical protein